MTKIVAIEDNLPSKDQLLRVEWNLSKRCNYDCSYCDPSTHDNKSKHMPLDVFESTVDRLVTAANLKGRKLKIAFTGGEPFAHPKILDMLHLANSKGVYKMSVTTNGSLPLDKYVAALTYLNYVIVSYHFEFAYHEKVINTIIGIDAACKKMTAEGNYRGFHTHVMFLPGYMEQTREICQTMKVHGINYVIRRIRPQFDAVTGDYLRPGQSGMIGVHNITNPNITKPYYTDEELEFMETGV